MVIDTKELCDEIENDPEGIGYKNEDGSWKGDTEVAGLINTAVPGSSITNPFITTSEIVNSLDYGEIVNLSDDDKWLLELITESGENISTESDTIKTTFYKAFTSDEALASGDEADNTKAPKTKANIFSYIKREASRAELVFGRGATITASHVGAAENRKGE